MRKILLLPVLAIVLSTGCYYDDEEELYPNTFCDTVNVTYSGTIDPIIQTKCAIPACHVAGGQGTGDFTDFDQLMVQVNNGRFIASVRREPGSIPMPSSGPLRPCELAQIEVWVADGAPNN